MRSACRSRTGAGQALLLLSCLLAGCGLFQRAPGPPSLEEVRAARRAEAEDWAWQEEALRRYEAEGPGVLEALEAEARSRRSPRAVALVQDLRLRHEDRSAVHAAALERWRRTGRPLDAWLAARTALDPDEALELARAAASGNPGLVQARVLVLGLSARAGDRQTLDALLDLLQEHPGSAEGWRLLGRLAPLYARPDLALAAAGTEPWSPLEEPRTAWIARARAALRALDPADPGPAARLALGLLEPLPATDREAELLRAAALAELGRAEEAFERLRALVRRDPGDLEARFNLGLLAWRYLGRPEAARRQLEAFLEAVEAGAEVPLQRQVQAEAWLDEIRRREAGG